jgi:hypothetical protein
VHLDGNQVRHDASVCQDGVFDIAVEAIKMALDKGFRVTINCTLFQGNQTHYVSGFPREYSHIADFRLKNPDTAKND